MSRRVIFGVMFGALAATGCTGGIDGDNRSDHGCSIQVNSDWESWGATLEIDHNDPRECPYELNVGESGTAGGTIVEHFVSFPNNGEASAANLKIWDTYSFNIWAGGGSILGSEYESFGWDIEDRWVAEVWAPFTAGPSPDFGEFVVDLFTCCVDPIAVNTINYWQENF
ncbi:MAG: hypothetical protein ACE5F5_12965 [Acidimicrobiia bacterium]